ncbi:MAG: glycosyltransferase family 2 protein [Varibaculum cambriense]|uniref:glycosyltransferase family 2 protein n=1 Tax=Varibaculum cambriense TaxID=184870 RepID=UPI00241CFBDF|nr:glycosyltransferase family 2 protein [Varibaculum cambriense]MBS5973475.1 glycosyltransferase family 2 protein [Varibaculum cambriense]
MPRISVIVPVYNVEKYLPRCLESIRKQDFSDLEIICINDGSSDASSALLELAAQLDPRMIIINQLNSGVSAARNRGLDTASGEIIMFVDADDFLVPGACKVVSQAFANNKPDILTFAASGITFGQPSPWLRNALSPKQSVVHGFDKNLFKKARERPYIWLSAFSRSFIEKHSLRFDEELAIGEDQLFYLDAYARAELTVTIEKTLYTYRAERTGSAMFWQIQDASEMFEKHLLLADKVFQHWNQMGLFSQYKAELLGWFLGFVSYDAFHAKNSVEALQKLREMVYKNFGNPTKLSLDMPSRMALRNLQDPKDPLRYLRNLAVLAARIKENPATNTLLAVDKFGKLAPIHLLRAIAKRIIPASSLTQYWRIIGAHDTTYNAIEDAQAYIRLINESSLTKSRGLTPPKEEYDCS